jgi:hypothetical protein
MARLALHGANAAVLCTGFQSGKKLKRTGHECNTDREEDPLKHDAVVVWLRNRVERKRMLGVVMLGEVEQDCRRLEDLEVASIRVYNGGDAPVRVDGNEPRPNYVFMMLILVALLRH